MIDYPAFMDVLRQVSDLPVNTFPVTVADVLAQNIPLPFPLEKGESELFDGSLITRELGLVYTPFPEGMRKAFAAFRNALR